MDQLVDAASGGDLARVQELSQEASDSVKEKALKSAAMGGQLEVVRYLIEHCNVNVNAKEGILGDTALIAAARSGRIESVRYLVVECGADANAKDMYGNTAVHYAAVYFPDTNFDVLRCLVKECGADVNTKNNRGEAAVDWANGVRRMKVVFFLVDECRVECSYVSATSYLFYR